MTNRKPHVRTETRLVYVSPRGSRFSKKAAYVLAAKVMIAANCECESEPEVGFLGVCRFHKPCCDDRSGRYGEGCDCRFRLPYYMKIKPRLARFLAFVDRKMAAQ